MAAERGTESAIDVKVDAVERRVRDIDERVRKHETMCSDDRTASARDLAAEAKRAARRSIALAVSIVATVFFAGGTWVATRNQVDEHERTLIEHSARLTAIAPAISSLVRNQRHLEAGQRQLRIQLEEIVMAEQEGRSARIVRASAIELEEVERDE